MRDNHDVLTSKMLVIEVVDILKRMHLDFQDWMPTLEDVLNDKTIGNDIIFNDDRKEEMFTYIEALRAIIHTYGIRLDLKCADLDVELTLESNYFDTLKYLNEYLLQPNHHHIKITIMRGDYIKVYINFERVLKDNHISHEPVMNIYQRALNQIHNACKEHHILEPIEILQTIVNKERTMPLMYEEEAGCYYCSYCRQVIEDETYQYCFRCGQKISITKK